MYSDFCHTVEGILKRFVPVVAVASLGPGVSGSRDNGLLKLANDTSGATAMEYGLLGAGISIAVAGIVFVIGADLIAMFESVHTYLTI